MNDAASSGERRLRIGVVGPVLPFRGGIAQHTTRLVRALRERADVTALSYSRQYPGWLFPGESDRDRDHEGHREPGVEYLVDSLNPLTWRRAAQRLAGLDAVVFPWWTIFWAPSVAYLTRAVRSRGGAVILLCHNVIEHESAGWKRWLSARIYRGGDAFMVHTEADASNLRSVLGAARVAVHPHPVYDQFPSPTGTLPRRRRLELLFFGFVRPYKGLPVLLDALAALRSEDVMLTVAGEFWEGLDEIQAQIDRLGIRGQVEMLPRFVGEQEMAELFHRADVVVLPYLSATGSGIIPIACHYERPVLATRVGGLPDVVDEGRSGWLVPPGDRAALGEAIQRLIEQDLGHTRDGIEKVRGRMSWAGFTEALMGLAQSERRT